MSNELNFYFIEPRHNNAPNSSDVIQSVKEMVARVIFALAQSGGQIGKITFESHASRGGGADGYFYIGRDEISHETIKLHARDLIKLAPHFAPDAQVMIYATCGSVFNVMARYMLSNLWPGVSVRTMDQPRCNSFQGHHHQHGRRSHFQGRWY